MMQPHSLISVLLFISRELSCKFEYVFLRQHGSKAYILNLLMRCSCCFSHTWTTVWLAAEFLCQKFVFFKHWNFIYLTYLLRTCYLLVLLVGVECLGCHGENNLLSSPMGEWGCMAHFIDDKKLRGSPSKSYLHPSTMRGRGGNPMLCLAELELRALHKVSVSY